MTNFIRGLGSVAHKTLVAIGIVCTFALGGAIADYAVTVGSGTTIFAFTCFTTKVCPASVPVTSAGAEILVATAALQTTGNSSLSTIASNTGAAIPAQSGIGNVNIGAVQSSGSAYETVAASQTGQALGATGATGDYLSHCVIYPVTTGAGLVTVFDNTNAAATNVITFATGTLSNLAPIAVPVGALSTAGAWKVTTGANVTVTCYGKFT